MSNDVLWPAPNASGPVTATVAVPGSKSLANRALILAALADGPSVITGLPGGARDLDLMAAALRALGHRVDVTSTTATLTPGAATGDRAVDCGLAGTVMRFVPPVAALRAGSTRFDGDARARQRPMAAMLAALRHLGIQVPPADTGLPFTVAGAGAVPGGPVTVDASGSSQFVSALLLSGARFDAGVTVHHAGGPVPSLPHIDMTVRLLAEHGVPVAVDVTDRRSARWRVEPGPLAAVDRRIEPDLSNAMPFAALALITGGTVTIPGWPSGSAQPIAAVTDLVAQLGGRAEVVADGLRVTGGPEVAGVSVDLRDLGELAPTVAAVCAVASGPSRLSGIGHIAGHETDRLAALARELNGLGGDVTADADGLTIRPRPLRGGVWRTYHDHRMATAGAIVGAVVPGVLVQDVATTAKTFPDFPDRWRAAVAGAVS